MRVLNAYAGIGGNRHLWPDDWAVTAVEIDDRIAAEYARRYPQDRVLVEDDDIGYAILYGSCSCNPWHLCGYHYKVYLADAPKRAMEKEARVEKMQRQQAKALARKRARRRAARATSADSGTEKP